MRTLTYFVFLFVFAAACASSDDEVSNNTTGMNNVSANNTPSNNTPSNNSPSNNTPSNNTPSNNTPSNNTPSNNTTSTNNASTNNTTGPNNTPSNNTAGTNNMTGVGLETEPNDDRDTANMVMLGDTISGTAEGGGEDFFVFSGSAGTILELEILSADPTLDVAVFVEDSASEVRERVINLRPDSKRQFFLPEAETWYIAVMSFDPEDRDYEMAIREVTPMPMTNAFSDTVVGNLNDRAVDVYELPDANGLVLAGVEAERLTDGSDLDSMMFIYSPNAGLVAFNDDSTTVATTDSELDFMATAGETYWLVVDAWRLGTNNPYELTVLMP